MQWCLFRSRLDGIFFSSVLKIRPNVYHIFGVVDLYSLILILINYAATSSCLALLQRSRACAAHNYLVLATKVLKLSTLFACTTLSSSWFQSTVDLGKKEFFRSSVLQWVTTYGLSLCLAYLFTGLIFFSPAGLHSAVVNALAEPAVAVAS